MTPRRPLRSVFLGQLRYCSMYRLGVGQATSTLGGWHRDVDVVAEATVIDKQIAEMRPDVVWTHMLLWPPPGAPLVEDLIEMAASWRRRWGTKVLLHDGDPRTAVRHPHNVSGAVDLALLNHTVDRSAWGIPVLHWPYAALAQPFILDATPEFRADLVFTGLLRDEAVDGLYAARTACVRELQARLGLRAYPDPATGDFNTRMITPEIAASCIAVIGFGRPEIPGWIDTRVFQYPGAGAILLHDDAHPEVTGLQPDEHYVAVPRYDVDAIAAALDRLRRIPEGARRAMRERAFAHVQNHHTYIHRVQQVFTVLGLS